MTKYKEKNLLNSFFAAEVTKIAKESGILNHIRNLSEVINDEYENNVTYKNIQSRKDLIEYSSEHLNETGKLPITAKYLELFHESNNNPVSSQKYYINELEQLVLTCYAYTKGKLCYNANLPTSYDEPTYRAKNVNLKPYDKNKLDSLDIIKYEPILYIKGHPSFYSKYENFTPSSVSLLIDGLRANFDSKINETINNFSNKLEDTLNKFKTFNIDDALEATKIEKGGIKNGRITFNITNPRNGNQMTSDWNNSTNRLAESLAQAGLKVQGDTHKYGKIYVSVKKEDLVYELLMSKINSKQVSIV